MLETPRQAARFVSLMPFVQTPCLGGGQRVECWASMNSFLAKHGGVSSEWPLYTTQLHIRVCQAGLTNAVHNLDLLS